MQSHGSVMMSKAQIIIKILAKQPSGLRLLYFIVAIKINIAMLKTNKAKQPKLVY